MRQKGFVVEIVTLPDGSERLGVTPSLLFDKAFPDIYNEAQSGRLGELRFGLLAGTPPARTNGGHSQ